MSGRGRSFAPPAVGGSSLLAIFGILCLTVFAVLSLSTAQADARLSEKSAAAVAAYYAADAQAEEIFARLRAGELPAGVTRSGGVCTYTVPVSDTQELWVELFSGAGGDWSVRSWKTVSVAEWQPDDSLTVWDGMPPA